MSTVIGTATVLFGYGCVVGAIYLRGFWGSFGINPFQFASPSDLAIVGLTAVGVTLILACVASLAGAMLGDKLVVFLKHHLVLPWFFIIVIFAGLAAVVYLIDGGYWIVIGMVGTWFLIWLCHKSPDVPDWLKSLRSLPLLALAITYLPIAAQFISLREASRIKVADSGWFVDVARSNLDKKYRSPMRFVGRIGEEYFFYEIPTGSVSIVKSSSSATLVLMKVKKVATSEP